MVATITAEEALLRYLFGEGPVPSNYESPSLIRPDAPGPKMLIGASEFMNAEGRFALPSMSPLAQTTDSDFFK